MSTCACGRPVGDAFVCQGCANRLEVDLGDIPALVTQLDIVIARQTAYMERVGSRSTDPPAFINDKASRLRINLHYTLQGWVRDVHEHTGRELPPDKTSALAGWLMREVEWLRHHEAKHEPFDEIGDAVRQVRHVIDAPANRTTFGVGPCPEEPCLGEVRAYFPADETKRPSMSCTVEPNHRWEPEQWERAGRRILRLINIRVTSRRRTLPASTSYPSPGSTSSHTAEVGARTA